MRDDAVDLTQKVLDAALEIKANGTTAERALRLAKLTLGLGNPEQAHDIAQKVIWRLDSTPQQDDEAMWIRILALCLKIAILEGTAEGAPGYDIERRLDDRADCRRTAIDYLQKLKQEGKITLDQDQLLTLLENGRPLKCIERFIQEIVSKV